MRLPFRHTGNTDARKFTKVPEGRKQPIPGIVVENEADKPGDADTADMFTEISRGIDKWLWFVEAHTQANKQARIAPGFGGGMGKPMPL